MDSAQSLQLKAALAHPALNVLCSIPLLDDSATPTSSQFPPPGLVQLRDAISREIRSIQSNNHPNSNAPYYLSLFNAILSLSSPLVAVGVFFPISDQKQVKVDVVADHGAHWIKVVSVKEPRLLAELHELDYAPNEESDVDPSLLQLGKSLCDAAQKLDAKPRITLILTRLREDSDPLIVSLLDQIRNLSISIHFGEPPPSDSWTESQTITKEPLGVASSIALDLSALVALLSDLVHSPLPSNVHDIRSGFAKINGKGESREIEPKSEALANQLTHELNQPLIPLICSRMHPQTTFFTSRQSLDVLETIVAKIGGAEERRRARALINNDQDGFWQGSRHQSQTLPLFPLQIYTDEVVTTSAVISGEATLTDHTREMLDLASQHQHTLLTSNRKSIRSITKAYTEDYLHGGVASSTPAQAAKWWLVEPRSLAEQLRNLDPQIASQWLSSNGSEP